MKKIGLLMIGLLVFGQAELSRTDKGVVKDNDTKLEWQDSYEEDKFITYSWGGAINYCEALNLEGKDDWRLPNINELKSIVLETQYAPSIDTKFQNIRNDAYWSSTRTKYNSKKVWGVSFSDGMVFTPAYTFYNFRRPHYVRCVRGGK